MKRVGGSRRRAKLCRSSVQEKGQIPEVGSHQERLERKPAFRLNRKRVGGQADVMSPCPRREAGPCTGVSFRKWMKGMFRSRASPRHFGSPSRMTSSSPPPPIPHCQLPTSWVRMASEAWDRQITLTHRQPPDRIADSLGTSGAPFPNTHQTWAAIHKMGHPQVTLSR